MHFVPQNLIIHWSENEYCRFYNLCSPSSSKIISDPYDSQHRQTTILRPTPSSKSYGR